MQIEAKKNTAYYLCWPMVNSTTPANFSSGLTVTVAAYYKDGIGAWTAFTPVDTPAEIGTTGIYEMDLSAAEMNHDKVLIKFTASGAAATAFMFDTRTKLTDDLNDLAQSDILSDATPFAGANVDAAISTRSSHAAADVWSVLTRTITGGTIDTVGDKTGYSITGTITTLDALNSQLATDHGAGSWTTATGFSTHTAADVWAVATRTLTASLDPTAAQIADAVWDELRADHVGVGSFGEGVASVQGSVTGSVASVTNAVTVGTNNDKTGYSLDATYDAAKTAAQAGDAMALTAAAVDAIWDELQSGHTVAGSFGYYLDAQISSVADPWATALPGAYAAGTAGYIVGTNLDAKISDIPTAAEIDAQLTASHGSGAWTSGGAGSGARTVTTTVNDGTNPIEGAKVRYTLGAENYVQTTDVNGQCTHNLDDGTWTVAITKAGYSFSGSTLAVSADATPTYSMTQVTITTSDPGFTTLFADVYDEDGTKTGAGTKVYLAIVSVPSGDTGHVFDSQPRVETTDSNGLVQFTNCVQGAVYELWRGRRGTPTRVTIGTDPTQAAPSIIGSD